MKKTMIYILAISALCAALLTGCGETRDYRTDTVNTPDNTGVLPEVDDLVPDMTEPDMNDGIVNDDNGIITENDNGNRTDYNNGTGTNGTMSNGTNANGSNQMSGTGGTTGSNGTGTARP